MARSRGPLPSYHPPGPCETLFERLAACMNAVAKFRCRKGALLRPLTLTLTLTPNPNTNPKSNTNPVARVRCRGP
eukprot:scaffold86141_cov27-Phaeocystis_antarctica.AAC.1